MIPQSQVPSPLVPRSAEESVADDFFDFAPYESSTPVSLHTDDYSHIRPYPDPSPPPPRRQRRRRIRSDGLQVVPVEDVMDDPTTIQIFAQDTRALITYDPEAVTPRPSLKKQKVTPRNDPHRSRSTSRSACACVLGGENTPHHSSAQCTARTTLELLESKSIGS
jgi:hypothetical protein